MSEQVAPEPEESQPAGAAVDLGSHLHCTATSDGPLVLALDGILTGESVTRLHAALLDLAPDQAARLTADDVTVDLSAVDAVDLDALHLLVRLDQALEARGHTLRLRRPTPALLKLVAGAGLLHALPLSTT